MAKTITKTEKTVAPFYAVAAIWILYGFLFKLHTLGDFLIVTALSFGAFCLVGNLFPDKEITVEVPDEPKETAKPSGNAQLDKMIKDGDLAISEMRRLNDNIADEKISRDIERLEKSSKAIFDQVKASPEKLPQIRKFMDYYLPTTLKLLNAYDRMSAAGIGGENIDATKQRVENMMTTIVAAFEKQYDALFGADALDISTDISVLETMMAREGFTGEKLEAETTKNADGTDLKLEL